MDPDNLPTAGGIHLSAYNMKLIGQAIAGGWRLPPALIDELPAGLTAIWMSHPSTNYRLKAAKLLMTCVSQNVALRRLEHDEKGGSKGAINVQVNLFQKLAEGLQAEQIERMKGRLLTVNPELKKDD